MDFLATAYRAEADYRMHQIDREILAARTARRRIRRVARRAAAVSASSKGDFAHRA